MSALCQKRTHAPQQILFRHAIGKCKQRRDWRYSSGAFIPSSDSGNTCSPRQRTSAAGQPYRELGEVADLAIDRERTAVLLRDDLVGDRQAEAGAFAGRLGGEERLEQFIPVFRRNADTVVAHPDLDASPNSRVVTFSVGL